MTGAFRYSVASIICLFGYAAAFGAVVIEGGRGWRVPLIERVDRLDLTNMIIEVEVHGAYSKGGIPLNVHGVANVKLPGEEPLLNNAIERFLGKPRADLMEIAKGRTVLLVTFDGPYTITYPRAEDAPRPRVFPLGY